MKKESLRCRVLNGAVEVLIFVKKPLVSFPPLHSVSNSLAAVDRNLIIKGLETPGNISLVSKLPVLALNHYKTRLISSGKLLWERLHLL